MSIDEADAEMMELAGLAETQDKERLAVHFLLEPQQDEEASKKAGRPIFTDVEVIEVRIPGDVDLRREVVNADHKRRFPKQYLAFKKNQSQEAASGTPLSAWPLLSRAQVEESKYLGAHTVEQLAEVSDGALQKFGPGWRTIRQQARDWLAKAADGALLARLRSELESRDAKIQTLEDMLNKQATALAQAGINGDRPSLAPVQALPDPKMAELEAKLERLIAAQSAAPAPKRRGRPPKHPQPTE